MSCDTAKEWGAKEKEGASRAGWELTAAQGWLTFEAESTSSKEMNSLRVSMNEKTFKAMQK